MLLPFVHLVDPLLASITFLPQNTLAFGLLFPLAGQDANGLSAPAVGPIRRLEILVSGGFLA